MRGIEQQFLALQKGLLELVPAQLLRPFDERELELVICGLGTIDINDWKANTRLKVGFVCLCLFQLEVQTLAQCNIPVLIFQSTIS